MVDEACDALSPTGVEGLDAILRGGLVANRLYLLLGAPGVGKTTIALQYLLHGAKSGERGLYIALSETRVEIESVARSHGWPLDEIAIFELSALEQQLAEESQNTVFHPADVELNKTTQLLLDNIQRVRPQRVVLDSLSELRLMSDTPLRYRRQMLSLKQFFTGEQMTVLLLDDHSADGGDLHVQSIAHGVLTLEQIVSDYGSARRRLKVNKMRGVNFAGGYHDAMIATGGVQVFPRLVATEHERPFKHEMVSSGVAGLDALVGGGLHRGTSALVLGPAGTGKSTIVAQFAAAAASRGEQVLICLFEENLEIAVLRAQSAGIDLAGPIAQGRITMMAVSPAELTPGEFVHRVVNHVRKHHVQLLVIDSLNGYLQAMPDVRFLNIQLHELLATMNRQGVLSFLTVAQHGLIGQMQTPVDLTYLADSAILLRYFEQGGRIKKAISVIKKRIGAHEETIREFQIGASGLQVGPPLEEFHGVLSGTPVFTGRPSQMLRS